MSDADAALGQKRRIRTRWERPSDVYGPLLSQLQLCIVQRSHAAHGKPFFTPPPAVDYSMQLLQNPHPTAVKRTGGTFRQVRPPPSPLGLNHQPVWSTVGKPESVLGESRGAKADEGNNLSEQKKLENDKRTKG